MTTPTPLRKQSANNFKRANNPLMLNRLQTPFKSRVLHYKRRPFRRQKAIFYRPFCRISENNRYICTCETDYLDNHYPRRPRRDMPLRLRRRTAPRSADSRHRQHSHRQRAARPDAARQPEAAHGRSYGGRMEPVLAGTREGRRQGFHRAQDGHGDAAPHRLLTRQTATRRSCRRYITTQAACTPTWMRATSPCNTSKKP